MLKQIDLTYNGVEYLMLYMSDKMTDEGQSDGYSEGYRACEFDRGEDEM